MHKNSACPLYGDMELLSKWRKFPWSLYKCWRAAWKIPKSTNRTLFAKTTDVANKTISCRDLEWCTWLKYSMFEASWAGELSLLKLFCWEGARLSVKLFACVTFQVRFRWKKCESWFEVKHLYYWRVQI